jgi:hypothetical protein
MKKNLLKKTILSVIAVFCYVSMLSIAFCADEKKGKDAPEVGAQGLQVLQAERDRQKRIVETLVDQVENPAVISFCLERIFFSQYPKISYEDAIQWVARLLPGLQDFTLCTLGVEDDSLAFPAVLYERLSGLSLIDLSNITDAGLAHIAGFSNLESLHLSSLPHITDDGLAYVASLRGLQKLTLSKIEKVTNAGLRHLMALSNLRDLRLSSMDIGDEGLEYISGLPLQKLCLDSMKSITDAGFEYIGHLGDLQQLVLRNSSKITGSGFVYLRGATLQRLELESLCMTRDGFCNLRSLQSLQHLSLDSLNYENPWAREKITASIVLNPIGHLLNLRGLKLNELPIGAQLVQLKDLENLEELKVSLLKRVTDNDLKELTSLVSLKKFELVMSSNHNEVTDAGLKHLSCLPELREVILYGSRVTEDGLIPFLNGWKVRIEEGSFGFKERTITLTR